MAKRHFLGPLLGENPSAFELRNGRNGRLIARSLLTAFDSPSRRQGLLGSKGLSAGTALVIAPCNAVHTCFMRFAIDAIFADRNGTVVSVAGSVKPWRVRAALRAFAVVELPTGVVSAADVRTGDRLMLVAAAESDVSRQILVAETDSGRVESTNAQR